MIVDNKYLRMCVCVCVGIGEYPENECAEGKMKGEAHKRILKSFRYYEPFNVDLQIL